MEGFLDNIGGSIGDVWRDSDERGGVHMDGEGAAEWHGVVIEQTERAYGVPGAEDVRRRDRALKEVVRLQREMDIGRGGKKQ